MTALHRNNNNKFKLGLSQVGFQNPASGSMSQTLKRLVFDLTYPLTGQTELLSDFFQR